MLQSRQIEAFRAVMLTGGMTAAAAMIDVTQPAVSRLIRDLEAELGLVLFQRQGNQVTPTEQARALLVEVERSFVGLQRIADCAGDLRAGRGGSIRVAALPAMANGFLPRFVARYSRAHPEVRFVVDGLPSSVVRDEVISGRVDIGMSLIPFKPNALVAAALEDDAVVVLPQDHPLARLDSIGAHNLDGENLVLLTKFMQGRHPVERALQSARPGTMITTTLSTVACVLASEGAGLTIVDPFAASEFVGRGMAVRRFEPPMPVGTAVVHSSERGLSAGAAAFHAAFLAHARDFLDRAEYLGAQ